METIDKFRDDELDYKPYATSWSVRQIMLHIAQEEHGEFGYGIAQTLPDFPAEYATGDYPTKETIMALLESVHAPVLNYLEEARGAQPGPDDYNTLGRQLPANRDA